MDDENRKRKRDQQYPPNKSLRTNTDTSTLVQLHYNARENQRPEERFQSRIATVRSYNNWVKSILISQHCSRGDIILDICGGKGGDVTKWNLAGISHLVLADIAEKSVQHAMDRYNKIRPQFTASFVCSNCHLPGLQRELEKLDYEFDLVSCQFALHYAFESQKQAEQLLSNVSCKLRPGGVFIGTIPSANRIVERVRSSPDKIKFGNEYYSVEFEETEKFPTFGAKYTFNLEDAVEGVPEFLVHFETLTDLAKKFNLKLEQKSNFSDFFSSAKPDKLELLTRMRHGDKSPIAKEFWEIINLYNAFVFRKEGEAKSNRRPAWSGRYSKVTSSDMQIISD